jgi:hypothetical protein
MGDIGERAQEIASEAKDVRTRVRELVSRAAGDGRKTLRELGEDAREILRGATEGVGEVAREHRGEVLGEVIDGVSDGLTSAANATRLALEEAEGRGEQFAEEDLRRTMDDLRSLETMFVDTVRNLSTSARDSAWGEVKDAASHARRAGESMRPSIQSALEAATRHPVRLAGEAATAGAAVTRRATGSLFQAIGGLLQGAGDAIRGDESERKG